MEIRTDIAPVMLQRLEDVRGIPETFIQGFARMGIRTLADLADWVEQPDANGYEGERKIKALRNIGDERASTLFMALDGIGVDLDRPYPSMPWIR